MTTKSYNVAIFTSTDISIAREFLLTKVSALMKNGLYVKLVIIDENLRKSQAPLRHAFVVAKRQAKISGRSTYLQILAMAIWKYFSKKTMTSSTGIIEPGKDGVAVIKVPDLNSGEAAAAVKQYGCDIVCLMGTRILSRKTLSMLSPRHVINIHSSDPRFVRGGPPVVWEIMDNKSSVNLTVHFVTDVLDGGRIIKQAPSPIYYSGGLGQTIQKTMETGRSAMVDLFEEAIRSIASGIVQGEEFEPGPLRVTPNPIQTMVAELQCRIRSSRVELTRFGC